jgi:hypothetical protein
LSFFDDVDEPQTAQRTPPRRRRPSGAGGRPPSDQQAIQVRRGVAIAVVVIALILIVLGVHSCQVSQHQSALKDYNNNVASLVKQSNATGAKIFQLLSSASSSNVSGLQNSINEARVSADAQLSQAQKLSVPDDMKKAQQQFVLAMQMRADGIATIADNIQQALGTTSAPAAIDTIAAEMARLYASDVVYKDYATHQIAAALKSAGIGIGGTNGQTIEEGQFVPNVQWVTPAYVASALHASLPSSHKRPSPGLHGHSLDSVTVAGTTLQTGSTNTIPASPAPTFTLHYTNGGQHNESNVVCKVTVSGTSVSGQTVITQTIAGQSGNCDVKLGSAPPTGSHQVVATIEPVPGEHDTANNTLTFPVSFQ